MRKIFTIIVLFIVFNANAQISFIGFDITNCGSPLTNVYSYSNYTFGSHGSGYKILKNGIQVYDKTNSLGPLSCLDLIFINDTIGFLIEKNTFANTSVYKTSNYGSSWTQIGGSAPNYWGYFVVNSHYGYLVANIANIVVVNKCSDIQTSINLILDDSVNTDVFITDSILYNSLCNIDSLQIFIRNDTDTITYHINFNLVTTLSTIKNPTIANEIFPCPASDHFSISDEIKDISSVTLLGINGQVVLQYSKKSISENYFDFPNIDNGIYIISVIGRKQAKHFKIEIRE